MAKRIIFLGLLGFVTFGSSGCGLMHRIQYCPLGPGTGCDPKYCIDDCGPAAYPPAGRPTCDTPCETPCSEPCRSCGLEHRCGPLTWFAGLFGPCWYGPSGGEIYWGDFHGDPPDCCDPCDRCGNFTGGYGNGSYAGGGCTSCGGNGGGELLSEEEYAPDMSTRPLNLKPALRVAQPRRIPRR